MAKQRAEVGEYLYINGVASRDLVLALILAGRVTRRKKVKDGTRTEKFLPAVADFLKYNKPSGIIVAQGGGSFSQTRIVCSIANALAYGWGIKVAALPPANTRPIPSLMKALRWGKMLRPQYSTAVVATPPKRARGFTLIELLVVIGIIALLATMGVTAYGSARSKGMNTRALADLRQTRTAIALLEGDTGKWPNGCPPESSHNPEVQLDQAQAGLRLRPTPGDQGTGCVWTQTDVNAWKGPYIDRVTDPWMSAYWFDPDYRIYQNCPGKIWNGVDTVVVYSPGPNKSAVNAYDCDDIFLQL